jgi:putative oxidoreductase
VHLKNGVWVSGGGYEYNLVLIATLLGLVDGGPGEFSLDRALGIHDTGPAWALAALAAGAGTSALVMEFGRRQAQREQQEDVSGQDGGRARQHAMAGSDSRS